MIVLRGRGLDIHVHGSPDTEEEGDYAGEDERKRSPSPRSGYPSWLIARVSRIISGGGVVVR